MEDIHDLFSPNQECLEFFNIPEARSAHYFLMDKRWNLIHYSKVDTFGFILSSHFEHSGNLSNHCTVKPCV